MAAQNSIDERGAAARQADDEYGGIARGIAAALLAVVRCGRKCLDDPVDGRDVDRDVVSHMFPALLCAPAQVLKRLRVIVDVFVFLGKRVPNLNVPSPIRNASRNERLGKPPEKPVHRRPIENEVRIIRCQRHCPVVCRQCTLLVIGAAEETSKRIM